MELMFKNINIFAGESSKYFFLKMEKVLWILKNKFSLFSSSSGIESSNQEKNAATDTLLITFDFFFF